MMEFPAPIHLLSLVLLLAGIGLAFSEIRLSGWIVAWILLSGALLVQGFRSILSYLFEHGGVDAATYNIANDWMGLGFSLLIVASMYMMREVFAKHRLAEDKLRIVSAAAQDAIIMMDNAGRIVFWNEAAQRIFGYSAQEAQGKKLQELIVPERYRSDFENGFGVFSSTGQGPVIGKTLELSGLRADGTEIVTEHSISGVNVDGKWHAICIFRDITERKQAEEALQFTRFSLDNATDTMVCVGRDARFADINDAFCRSSGYSREELLSMSVHDIDPDYSAEIWPDFWEKLKQSGFLTFESRHRTKDGKVYPVEIAARFFEYNGKEYHCGFARDITERKRAGAALRESERKLRLIAENATDVIFAYDMDHRLIYVNPALEELTGYTVAELRERNFINWLHPEDEAKIKALWEDLFAGKGFSGEEFRIVTKDGQIKWCSSSWGLLYDESGRQIGVQGRERDITERKRAENELKTSYEQLRVLAARLSTAREEETILLAREIHDELGQALTGLKMDLSWFASRLGQDRRALKKKADSMLGLVDTTIDCIRNIATRLRPKMLDDLGLVAAIEWQAQEFRKHAGVKCEVVSSMDTAKLGQHQSIAVFRIAQEALTNIARHAAPTKVDISLHEEFGCLILEVRDNGKGIRVEEIAADKSIGLLGMRERALAAGGELTLEGFPGRGTVVTLRVPLPAQ